MKKQIGIIGLGKMGGSIALNLRGKGWDVYGYNRTPEVTQEFQRKKIKGAYSLQELKNSLKSPRIFWVMVTAGEPTNEIITQLSEIAEPGDYIIDAGNSHYKDSERLGKELEIKEINFLGIGVAGGPDGARNGASLMVGCRSEVIKELTRLFEDLSYEGDGYKFFEGYGAGHFVKMIHNGIEYGMMQSIAEGFNLMKNSNYDLDLLDVTDVYQKGSVIESRLIDFLKKGFEEYGQDLEEVSGTVGMLGEAQWTVNFAKEKKLKAKIIEESLNFRKQSEKNPSYTGKILSALRNIFGGHSIK